MSLPFDVSMCLAHKPYGILATPCRDCHRYTNTEHGDRQSWMSEAPPFINGVCAYRIAHEGEKNGR